MENCNGDHNCTTDRLSSVSTNSVYSQRTVVKVVSPAVPAGAGQSLESREEEDKGQSEEKGFKRGVGLKVLHVQRFSPN